MKIRVVLLILYFIVSCKSVETDKKENQLEALNTEKLTLIATEKYEKNFTLEYNSNKDFALCIHKNKSNIPGPESINFFVYDLINNKITYENNISKGSVSWQSEYEIKLEEIPGTIQKNMTSTNVYILNIKTNSKTKLDGEVK